MAESKKGPDWTRTGTVSGYAKYLGEKSRAICVLVIRPHDSVFWVDPRCKAEDAEDLVAAYTPRLAERVDLARREKRASARLELGENRE
jgi:cysteine synthase